MSIQGQIAELIGAENIISRTDGKMDELTFNSYGVDRTKLHQANYDYLVFPRSTLDVSKIVKYAYDNNFAIVPSGGRTGYAVGQLQRTKKLLYHYQKWIKRLILIHF
jgi:FAD/FMN-containing dehydrogenase